MPDDRVPAAGVRCCSMSIPPIATARKLVTPQAALDLGGVRPQMVRPRPRRDAGAERDPRAGARLSRSPSRKPAGWISTANSASSCCIAARADFHFLIVSHLARLERIVEIGLLQAERRHARLLRSSRARAGTRAPYCVWELGPVWHEQQAWVRFLTSSRDAAAQQAYLDDRFCRPGRLARPSQRRDRAAI